MTTPSAVILAAGKSTRMKSDVPKVLHPICGRPMIEYVLDAARDAGVGKLIVVVGHCADLVRSALSGHSDVVFAEQTEQNGTGHAVQMCAPHLQGHDGSVLILAGDTPLLKGASLKALLDEQQQQGAACVVGSADTRNNHGLGRIVRNSAGEFTAIVEHKDATEDQRRITEINTGCYSFSTPLLLDSLAKLQPNNVQAEYYLTDCPKILMDGGHKVAARCSLTIEEAMGVNTRVQLAEVTVRIQDDIFQNHMLNGVTVEQPSSTTIDVGVRIGRDTVIRPCTLLTGDLSVGENCRLGPHLILEGPREVADGTVLAAGG